MNKDLSLSRKIIFTLLRIIIGGHFFFNGLIKIINPSWSAQSYLEGSYGVFKWLAVQHGFMQWIDLMNMWGLLLIGVALIVGVLESFASVSGIVLLGLYYFAYPPFNVLTASSAGGGPAFIVNPLLIEIIALIVILIVPTGKIFGIERIFQRWLNGKKQKKNADTGAMGSYRNGRREIIKSLGAIPFLGVFSIPFIHKELYENLDAISGATPAVLEEGFVREYQRLKNLDLDKNARVQANRKEMHYGKIGNLKISRMICGNSNISMSLHARDLRYVSELAKNYNAEGRIFMTLKLLEKNGVNTLFLNYMNFVNFNLQNYWNEWGGRMQWIAEPLTFDIDRFEALLVKHLKLGAKGACIWGEACDRWISEKKHDNIPKALEIIKKYNVPAGIGAYYNAPIEFALKENLRPDFFYKSFHQDAYWSAHPRQYRQTMEMYKGNSTDHNRYHDNLWCQKPEAFAEMMKDVDIPWIAFKTMAAGALSPAEGFDFAFQNGADYVCASMFYFQVVENVRTVIKSFEAAKHRERLWIA